MVIFRSSRGVISSTRRVSVLKMRTVGPAYGSEARGGRTVRSQLPLEWGSDRPVESDAAPIRPRLRRERTVLERDGEHDRRTRLHAALLADPAQEILQVAGRARAHLEEVVRLSGDAQAVLHLRELHDALGKVVRLLRIERHHGDDGRDEQTHRFGLYLGSIAADHALLLEL